MDASMFMLIVCWLFLVFAIPGAALATIKELRQPVVCSPLVVMLLVITGVMVFAFIVFTKTILPIANAFFL